MLKRFMPKSLLGRSLLIIVTPLILLQLVAGIIFYETHWDKMTLRLARGVAGEIGGVIELMRRIPEHVNRDEVFSVASMNFDLEMEFEQDAVLKRGHKGDDGLMEEMLISAMTDYVRKPFTIDTVTMKRYVIIDVQLPNGILHTIAPKKRLFSSTAIVFVLWMIGTSLILFSIATIFMRNQVRPIRRLAIAADNFGKGRDVSRFKPEGAIEVRQAASAFLAMRDRIIRQIRQRTDMLAGVSHDLRTPLTRMRLELEMLSDNVAAGNLKSDVTEMEHMLEGYLAFARGEGTEQPKSTNLTALVEGVVSQARRKDILIDFHPEADLVMPLRPNAFRRSITNLVENAALFGAHVSVRVGQRDDAIEVIVDDDGPGIAEAYREDVFKPFFRVEGSRNQGTGGIGLGLTITRDVIRSHGGDVELTTSPLGGLRVKIRIPV
ncbi:MAG: HAMP domain-containing protein [Rhodospirillales bacterium]|nr:HAMP domain-containing protein [Rhodospirillales bacterium]